MQQSIFLRALKKQPVDRTPVWIMRQAGRYLPEYREIKQRTGDFMAMASNPEIACEITLQPLRRFDLDAAIIFSDILTIPDAMGLGLHFISGVGPRFDRPITDVRQIEQLPVVQADDLQYVMDAVSLTRRELDAAVPLIGFSGSPWTLLTYMLENGGSKTFSKAKSLLFKHPQAAETLLDKLSESIVNYLHGQALNGAAALQIFDSWGGVLSPPMFERFSLRPMRRIVAGLRERGLSDVPIILFSKGANESLAALAESGCDALGLDWTIGIDEAWRRTGGRVALQGNLDPATLYADDAVIERAVQEVLTAHGQRPGHVFNLGHGMQPDMQPEKLAVLINAVRTHSAR